MKINWEENASSLDFNYKIQLSVDECSELGVHQNPIDQVMVYLSKVSANRADNSVLFTAMSTVKTSEVDSLAEAMEKVAEVILRHSTDGILPFDGPTATINYIQNNNQHQPKANSTNPDNTKAKPRGNSKKKHNCYYCGQEFTNSRQHLAICKGTSHTCGKGGERHMEAVCEKFRKQLTSFEEFKQRMKKKKQTPDDTTPNPSNYAMQPVKGEDTRDLLTRLLTGETYCTLHSQYSPESNHNAEAGVDTCSSCMAFSDPQYFEVLDLKKKGKH